MLVKCNSSREELSRYSFRTFSVEATQGIPQVIFIKNDLEDLKQASSKKDLSGQSPMINFISTLVQTRWELLIRHPLDETIP